MLHTPSKPPQKWNIPLNKNTGNENEKRNLILKNQIDDKAKINCLFAAQQHDLKLQSPDWC